MIEFNKRIKDLNRRERLEVILALHNSIDENKNKQIIIPQTKNEALLNIRHDNPLVREICQLILRGE